MNKVIEAIEVSEQLGLIKEDLLSSQEGLEALNTDLPEYPYSRQMNVNFRLLLLESLIRRIGFIESDRVEMVKVLERHSVDIPDIDTPYEADSIIKFFESERRAFQDLQSTLSEHVPEIAHQWLGIYVNELGHFIKGLNFLEKSSNSFENDNSSSARIIEDPEVFEESVSATSDVVSSGAGLDDEPQERTVLTEGMAPDNTQFDEDFEEEFQGIMPADFADQSGEDLEELGPDSAVTSEGLLEEIEIEEQTSKIPEIDTFGRILQRVKGWKDSAISLMHDSEFSDGDLVDTIEESDVYDRFSEVDLPEENRSARSDQRVTKENPSDANYFDALKDEGSEVFEIGEEDLLISEDSSDVVATPPAPNVEPQEDPQNEALDVDVQIADAPNLIVVPEGERDSIQTKNPDQDRIVLPEEANKKYAERKYPHRCEIDDVGNILLAKPDVDSEKNTIYSFQFAGIDVPPLTATLFVASTEMTQDTFQSYLCANGLKLADPASPQVICDTIKNVVIKNRKNREDSAAGLFGSSPLFALDIAKRNFTDETGSVTSLFCALRSGGIEIDNGTLVLKNTGVLSQLKPNEYKKIKYAFVEPATVT